MKYLFLMLLTCGAALAVDPAVAPDPVDKLLEVIHFEDLAVDSANAAFEGYTKQMADQGIPAAAIAEIRAEARKLYDRVLRAGNFRAKTKALYNKHFTQAEIEELIAFYETSLGQKTLAALPSIMSEAMAMGMAAVQKEMPDFQKKVAGIVEKYQA